MYQTVCPGCGCLIKVAEHEVVIVFQCSRCHIQFIPALALTQQSPRSSARLEQIPDQLPLLLPLETVEPPALPSIHMLTEPVLSSVHGIVDEEYEPPSRSWPVALAIFLTGTTALMAIVAFVVNVDRQRMPEKVKSAAGQATQRGHADPKRQRAKDPQETPLAGDLVGRLDEGPKSGNDANPVPSESPPTPTPLPQLPKTPVNPTLSPKLPGNEAKAIRLPGNLLRELVPGYETRQIQGFTLLLSTQAIREAQKENGRPFQALLAEFDSLIEVLPPTALKALRRVLIWVEWDNSDRANPHTLAKYYGGRIWRLDGSQHPLKSNAVEVLSLKKLAIEKNLSIERTRIVLLHELAHAVHHVLLGLDNHDVKFAYNQAMDRRLYDRVPDQRGGVGRAYAATNTAEYFAELSCAYLDRCQYFPFTHEELQEHDPTGYRLMQGVWGRMSQR
jgi:hypothetical protein